VATFKGVNCTLAQPGPTRAPIVSGDAGGDERGYYDEYVVLGTEVINDLVQFGPPAGGLLLGDRVIGVSLFWDALGAGALLSLGDDGNAARFIAAVDAHLVATAPQGIGVAAGFGWQVDQDRPMLLKFTGANPAAAAKIRCSWRVLRA
jgi:hypothetical protein